MKRKIKVFLLSAIITAFLLIVIFEIGKSGLTDSTSFVIGHESPSYSAITITTKGPSYFFPFADVYVSLTNPYAEYIQNFTVYYSIDNLTWVQVPFHTVASTPTKIATVSLYSFYIPIYLKVYFQTQSINVQNQTVSAADVMASFHNDISFTPLIGSQGWVIFFLLGIAVFSFMLRILDFLTKKDSEAMN